MSFPLLTIPGSLPFGQNFRRHPQIPRSFSLPLDPLFYFLSSSGFRQGNGFQPPLPPCFPPFPFCKGPWLWCHGLVIPLQSCGVPARPVPSAGVPWAAVPGAWGHHLEEAPDKQPFFAVYAFPDLHGTRRYLAFWPVWAPRFLFFFGVFSELADEGQTTSLALTSNAFTSAFDSLFSLPQKTRAGRRCPNPPGPSFMAR